MHRPTIAALAILLLSGGVYLSLTGDDDAFTLGLNAACWRVGGLLVALWIAHPQLARWPAWLYVLFLIAALTIAMRPRLAIVVVPLIAIAMWVRPKRSSEPPRAH